MPKNRLEAFSDGVLAIVITIMILELKVPHGSDFRALASVLPAFVVYVLSFVYVGIYWSNHHHLLHTVQVVNGRILWANLHLLFWLSLIPVSTAWLGQHPRAELPTALYGIILLMAACAYLLLERMIIAAGGNASVLARAVGREAKEFLSIVLYAVGIAVAFFNTWIANAFYLLVAVLWFIPDPRIERRTGRE